CHSNTYLERKQVNLVEPETVDEEKDTEGEDEHEEVEFAIEECVERLTFVLQRTFSSPDEGGQRYYIF
ncbi:Hypothetical predicted protein, partial [Olea europaea subsp. europaea]